MSIIDYFRSAPAATPAQAPAQQAPAAQAAPAATEASTTPAAEATPENPMDAFSKLWEAPKEGDPKPANFDPSSLFQVDPAKVQQAVSQMNFATAITPEIMQQIAAGGEDATKAFMQAMNSVAQQSFAQSMIGSAKLVEQAMTKANDSLDARLKEGIRQQQISSSLRDSNPALSHPAAQPLVAALEAQFTQKYPTASPTEITKMAQDYLSKFAASVSPAQPSPQQQQATKETDWDLFIKS